MLKPRFDSPKIKRAIAEHAKRIIKAITNRLDFIGQEFVNSARSKVSDAYFVEVAGRGKTAFHRAGPRVKLITESTPSFIDQTGNLRSSIAYIVLHNGKTITEDYEKTGTGAEGFKKAKALINNLKKKYQNGIALIVVAGENYAAAVESKGFDVITGSSIVAGDELKEAFAKFKKR